MCKLPHYSVSNKVKEIADCCQRIIEPLIGRGINRDICRSLNPLVKFNQVENLACQLLFIIHCLYSNRILYLLLEGGVSWVSESVARKTFNEVCECGEVRVLLVELKVLQTPSI